MLKISLSNDATYAYYLYMDIYIVYMWQMSVESAQRNDAGHLIDENLADLIDATALNSGMLQHNNYVL